MDLGLLGARVLVTAASRGLGAATARRFSLEGARVVISSRNLEALQKTASEIVGESSNPVFTVAGDVSEPESVKRLVNNAVESLDGLDILVINAGGPPAGTFDDFDADAWEKAVHLTLLSAVSLVQAALPHLRKSAENKPSRAAILSINSTAARQPIGNLMLSNTIRPGLLGLVKSLSQELGPQGIRVNSILPGTTDTQRIAELMEARSKKNNSTVEEERAKAASENPLRRIGQAEEFANAAVFLCAPAASFITGVSLAVDGGTIRAT